MKKCLYAVCLFFILSCDSGKVLVENDYGLLLDFSKSKINNSNFDFENRSNEVISLNISNNNLNVIPDFVFKLENLKYLWLDNNEICCIPNDIIKLKKLEKIGLNNTNVRELSSNFFELENLEYLIYLENDLTKNEIDKILCLLPKNSSAYFIKEEITKSTYPCDGKLANESN